MFFTKGHDGNFSTKAPASSLELDHLSLSLLVATQLEMLATSQRSLFAVLALGTFHTQDNFLGGLGLKDNQMMRSTFKTVMEKSYLLSEDWFGLSTETLLFTIVTTTTLRSFSLLRLLIL